MIYIYCSSALGNYFYPDLCPDNWGSNYATGVKYDDTSISARINETKSSKRRPVRSQMKLSNVLRVIQNHQNTKRKFPVTSRNERVAKLMPIQ